MFKVELQDNSDKTGFWVYIVNAETYSEFMFRYIQFSANDIIKNRQDKIKSDEIDQAERLIKFMKGK